LTIKSIHSNKKAYAILEDNKIRLPTFELLDDNFFCWWWNKLDKSWIYKFLVVIGNDSIDENYFIKEPSEYHMKIASSLIDKGFTHFIPIISERY
jgi:hypothetical protein